MKKRIFATLMCLIMVLTLLPVTAYAVEATQSADFKTDPTAALALLNAAKTGTEDSTWDPDNKILTLNGVNFSTSVPDSISTNVAALIIPSGTTIVLGAGTTNTIQATGSEGSALFCPEDGDNILIYGAGTISFIGAPDSGEGVGSNGRGVNLSIGGGAVVNMTGGGDAIYLNGNDETVLGIDELTITGSATYNDFTNLTPAGFDPEWPNSAYMGEGGSSSDSALSLRIVHSVVQIGGQKLTRDTPCYHNGVDGGPGTVDNVAEGANAFYNTTENTLTLDGLNVADSMAIRTVNMTSIAYGMHTNDSLTINLNGTNTVTVADGANDSVAVWGEGNLRVGGNGSLGATGGNTQSASYGVSADSVIVSGGELYATGGSVSGNSGFSVGVYAEGGAQLTSGVLSCTGGATTGTGGNSVGAMGVITVNGGVFTAKANDNAVTRVAAASELILGTGVTAQGSTSASGTNPVAYVAADYATYLWGRAQAESDTVATPTFSVAGGSYTSAQSVTLSCATTGATIRYTDDGSEPTESSTLYNGAISVSSTATLKAKAFKSGMTASETASAAYTITITPPPVQTVATPAFSVAGGSYTSAQSVTISCTTPGATICYTDDGSEPTESSTLYNGAISVSSTTTLKAKAFKSGMTASAAATAAYTIPIPEQLPTVCSVLEGADGSWQKDSAQVLAFRINADYAKFQGVSVDGSPIDAGYYTAQAGSTAVTLKTAYLQSLSVGKHTLRVLFTDGYAEASFTITSGATDPLSPQTGDSGNPALWIGLLLIAGAGLTVTSAYFKNKKRGAAK